MTCRNQDKGEAQIICCNCREKFHVPLTTTIFRCSRCQATTSSSSRKGQLNKDSGNEMGLVKSPLANKNMIKSDHISQNASKSAYVLNQRPHSFSSVRSFSSWVRSNKRAVLCGVTYRKKSYRLKGSVNDVANMRDLLVKVFDFPTEYIHELTEEKQSANFHPTKKNILRELKWLVEGCQKGDSLVFYFSGHGIQQTDSKEDKIDAMYESICPVDFLHEGAILDVEMNSILVWPLQDGVTLHVIVDACHSGTVLDLLYVYETERCTWKDNKPPSKEPSRKHPNGGRAICISACEDHQLAADTSAFRGKGVNGVMTYPSREVIKSDHISQNAKSEYVLNQSLCSFSSAFPGKGLNSVMTYLFTKVIKQNPDITYGGLMEQMGKEIEEIMRNNRRSSFFQHMFRPRIVQDIVISSSEKFDISRTIFAL